jgi:hypothetical protein
LRMVNTTTHTDSESADDCTAEPRFYATT